MERRSNITSSPGLIPAMLVIDQSSDAAFVDVKDSRRRVSSLWLGEEIFRLCRDREKLVYNGQTTSAGSATDGDDLELFNSSLRWTQSSNYRDRLTRKLKGSSELWLRFCPSLSRTSRSN